MDLQAVLSAIARTASEAERAANGRWVQDSVI